MPLELPNSFFDLYGTPALMVVFILLLVLERRYPLRRTTRHFFRRGLVNGVVALPALAVLRFALLPAVVAAALWTESQGLGAFHWLSIPEPLAAVFGFLWLDYAIYIWHRLTHHVPLLWRFHNVHHTDEDLSVATAARFHFGEMLISAAFRSLAVLVMGVSPSVVLVYELVFQLSVAFHHSNWRLPFRLERALLWLVVTPRMHGIHHSVVRQETNSNYSSLLTIWDRIHGTLRLDVAQRDLTIGIPAYRDASSRTISSLWKMPFPRQRPYWEPAAAGRHDEGGHEEEKRASE